MKMEVLNLFNEKFQSSLRENQRLENYFEHIDYYLNTDLNYELPENHHRFSVILHTGSISAVYVPKVDGRWDFYKAYKLNGKNVTANESKKIVQQLFRLHLHGYNKIDVIEFRSIIDWYLPFAGFVQDTEPSELSDRIDTLKDMIDDGLTHYASRLMETFIWNYLQHRY